MDKLELHVVRAEEAERILNSEIWTKAFGDVRRALVNTWAGLETADTENARDIHRRLKCLDSVKRALEEHISTGKLATKELEGREQKRLFFLNRR